MSQEQLKSEITLNKLRTKLQLIQAFKSLSIKFNGKQFPKEIKEQVSNEIQDYANRRIEEIDTDRTTSSAQQIEILFTEQEVSALKHLASRVLSNIGSSEKETSLPESPKDGFAGVLGQTLRDGIGEGIYNNQKVKIMARRNGKIVVKFPNGQKTVVEESEVK